MQNINDAILDFSPDSPRSNLKLLAGLHHLLRPRIYLEIGIRWGDSLVLSGDHSLALGIDPDPRLRTVLPRRTWISRRTSDDFFRRYKMLCRLSPWKVNLGLIDGMHLAEFVIRDFINLEQISAPTSVIVLDDTNPPIEAWTSRNQIKGKWTGDVWKALTIIQKYRPDLAITTFDVQPAGLSIIRKLDPGNTTLADQYENILLELEQLDYARDFSSCLGRKVQQYAPPKLIEVLS